MKTLLTILTNAAHLTLTDGEEYPSGFWAEEFAVPYQMFREAGYAVGFATLGGIAPTVDKSWQASPPFAGYRVTCFSHVEEFYTRVNGRLPLVLEIEPKRLGLEYSKGPYPWASHVVVDRNLVTGQSPFSSEAMAKQFLDLLEKP